MVRMNGIYSVGAQDYRKNAPGTAQFRHKSGPSMILLIQSASLIALSTLFLAGCGGSDESAKDQLSSNTAIEGVTDEQLDAAVDQTRNRVKDALQAQGLGSETSNGGYAVEGEHDGESFAIGVDLDTPAWLPAEFPLPKDLAISMVTTDKLGRRELRGTSTSVTQSQIAELVTLWAANHDWGVMRTTDEIITLTNSDGDVLDVRANDGAELEIRLSKRDLTEERQESAPERKGQGSADITMASDTRTVAGECLIKGSNYQFEYSAPDGSVFANVQIQDANNSPAGSASFMTTAQGSFQQFSINFPMGNDNEPVVTTVEDQFSVSGKFANMGGGGMSLVDGNISVNCEF